jgi:glycosyltransferase involved in cell wall biosynthesis
MFCSIIIPTIGRATLARAVDSVLAQSLPADSFELIVVNDSGRPLTPEPWQELAQVRLINTQRRKLCVARNTGAAVAHGSHLLFLDDDDWLMPGALDYFWELAKKCPACGCFFGSFELVDDDNQVIARYGLPTSGNAAVQVISGLWLQVAAVLIRADAFFAAGGFHPQFQISEEIDLFNRLALHQDFVGQDVVVAQISRGQSWQTTFDYSNVYEYNRWTRDSALSQPGAFQRLQQSAYNSYWHGRILRLYFVSMLWNWRRKRRFFIGLSRGIFAFSSMIYAHKHLLNRNYWHGAKDEVPQFHR